MVKTKLSSMPVKDRAFEILIWILGGLVFLAMVYPIWFVIIASFSEPGFIQNGKVWFLPVGFNLDGYAEVFRDSRIWTGYANTLYVVILGTLLSMVTTVPCAYALSRKDFKARRIVMIFFLITMYFNGGLIPTYLTISKTLHMDNTRWVMIIPFCVNVYNLIVCRTFFATSLPQELLEAAKLDGCSNTRYFVSIALPLSKAILSVIMLYYIVQRWNDYFTALIYIRDSNLKPLQIVLRDILLMNESLQGTGANSYVASDNLRKAELVKYGSIIVSTLPIMILYPFLQKYFEKGVMIGALKG